MLVAVVSCPFIPADIWVWCAERLFVEPARCRLSCPTFLNTLLELEEPTPFLRSSRSYLARSIYCCRFCAYWAASTLPFWVRRPVEFILCRCLARLDFLLQAFRS